MAKVTESCGLTREVQLRNTRPMFYTIYSNNCQHFILDLCEYMDLQFESSNLHMLWLKSRLTFLGCCLLSACFTISLPYLTTGVIYIKVVQPRDHTPFIYPLLALFGFILVVFIFLQFLLSPVYFGLSWLALTMSGTRYMHGSCYTGPILRARLLGTPSRKTHIAYRVLLRLERIPYPMFSIFGFFVAICYALLQLLNRSYYFGDLEPVYVYWAVFFSEVFAYAFGICMLGTIVFDQYIRLWASEQYPA